MFVGLCKWCKLFICSVTLQESLIYEISFTFPKDLSVLFMSVVLQHIIFHVGGAIIEEYYAQLFYNIVSRIAPTKGNYLYAVATRVTLKF